MHGWIVAESLWVAKNSQDGLSPLRIIVSTVDSPLHQFGKFLHNIIHDAIPKTESHIINSFDLVDKLSHLRCDNNFKLLSLDVVSLFTNIPLDLALENENKMGSYKEKMQYSERGILSGYLLCFEFHIFLV